MAAITAAPTVTSLLKTTFTLKIKANIGSGLADLTTQLGTNGFNLNKVNLVSVVGNTLIGGNPFGSAITNSFASSTVNLSFENVTQAVNTGSLSPLGPGSFNSWAKDFGTGTLGNISGNFLGGAMSSDFGKVGGEFLGNSFGNLSGWSLNQFFK
jgi:hypothetical protein